MSKVHTATKRDLCVTAGLLFLTLIPAIGGMVRLAELGRGAAVTPQNARFFEAPIPAVVHILTAVVYCALGAFQFSPGFRRRRPDWHRAAGRVLIPIGLAAALSGLWMTHTYAWPEFDGRALYWIRWVVGISMTGSLGLGYLAVRRRDFSAHGAWMMRAYALGLGAGTQALTHLPWFIFPSIRGELARTLCMGAGWAINLAVAEYLIFRLARPASMGPVRVGAGA